MDPILLENSYKDEEKKLDLYKADIYSLGICFFHVVTKKMLPFDRNARGNKLWESINKIRKYERWAFN